MLEKELKNLDKQIFDFVKSIDFHEVTVLRSLPGVDLVYVADIAWNSHDFNSRKYNEVVTHKHKRTLVLTTRNSLDLPIA